VNMNPVGDWTTQAEYPNVFGALGAETVRQRAAEDDMEAQFSLGCRLVNEADGVEGATTLGRGLHSSTFQLNLSRFRHKTHPPHPILPANACYTPTK